MRRVIPGMLAIVLLGLGMVGSATVVRAQNVSKADIFPVAGSGVAGVVVFETAGKQTKVFVALLGGHFGNTFVGEIRTGTCGKPGGTGIRLGRTARAADGVDRLQTVVTVPSAVLHDGKHLVLFRAPSGALIACGGIAGHHRTAATTAPRRTLPMTGGVPLARAFPLGATLGLALIGAGIVIRRHAP